MKQQSKWTVVTAAVALVAMVWVGNSMAGKEEAKAGTSKMEANAMLEVLPDAVRDVVLEEVGDGEITGVYHTVDEEVKTYLIMWTGEDGVSSEITVTAEGKILTHTTKAAKGDAEVEDDDDDDEGEIEKAITIEELPDAARATILKEAGDHEILELEEMTYEGKIFYEAEWLEDGMEVEVAVTPEGEVIGREIEEPDDETEEDDD